jgi:hypothetical protein
MGSQIDEAAITLTAWRGTHGTTPARDRMASAPQPLFSGELLMLTTGHQNPSKLFGANMGCRSRQWSSGQCRAKTTYWCNRTSVVTLLPKFDRQCRPEDSPVPRRRVRRAIPNHRAGDDPPSPRRTGEGGGTGKTAESRRPRVCPGTEPASLRKPLREPPQSPSLFRACPDTEAPKGNSTIRWRTAGRSSFPPPTPKGPAREAASSV